MHYWLEAQHKLVPSTLIRLLACRVHDSILSTHGLEWQACLYAPSTFGPSSRVRTAVSRYHPVPDFKTLGLGHWRVSLQL